MLMDWYWADLDLQGEERVGQDLNYVFHSDEDCFLWHFSELEQSIRDVLVLSLLQVKVPFSINKSLLIILTPSSHIVKLQV